MSCVDISMTFRAWTMLPAKKASGWTAAHSTGVRFIGFMLLSPLSLLPRAERVNIAVAHVCLGMTLQKRDDVSGIVGLQFCDHFGFCLRCRFLSEGGKLRPVRVP